MRACFLQTTGKSTMTRCSVPKARTLACGGPQLVQLAVVEWQFCVAVERESAMPWISPPWRLSGKDSKDV